MSESKTEGRYEAGQQKVDRLLEKRGSSKCPWSSFASWGRGTLAPVQYGRVLQGVGHAVAQAHFLAARQSWCQYEKSMKNMQKYKKLNSIVSEPITQNELPS